MLPMIRPMAHDPKHGKAADIADQPYGKVVPANMTSAVCKNKPQAQPASAADMVGWAISFGNYDDPGKADMALRGRLIAPAGIDAGGTGGVVKMPGTTGYAALLWNIDQARSLSLCAKYRAEGAPCEVIPETLVQVMASTARDNPKIKIIDGPQQDEGSDAGNR